MIIVHNSGLTGDTNKAKVREFVCSMVVVPSAFGRLR